MHSIEGPHNPRGYRELRSSAEMRELVTRKIAEQDRKCAICHGAKAGGSQFGNTVPGAYTPVLAKRPKHFSLEDSLAEDYSRPVGQCLRICALLPVRGLVGIALATESISHIKLNRFVNFSGPAPCLQIWEICLAGLITQSANSNANEGFRTKPKAG